MQSSNEIPVQAVVEFPGLSFSPVPSIPLPPPPQLQHIPAAPTRTSKSSAGKIAVAGRWTIEEHKLFLEGLGIHGKAWKKIATSIRTRSVTQVRTHAQKYFLKQSKGKKYVNDETQIAGDMLPCSPHDLTFSLQPTLQKRKLDDISTGIQSSATSKDWNSDFALFLDSSKLHPSEFSILGTCFETNPNLSSIANDTRNLSMIPPTNSLPRVTVDIKAANITTTMSKLPTKKLCVEKKGNQQQFSPKSICNSLSFEDLPHHHSMSYGECTNSMTSLYRDAFQNEENMLAHMLPPNSTAIASVTMEDILLMKDEDIYDDMIPNYLDHVTVDSFDSFFEYESSPCSIETFDQSENHKHAAVQNCQISHAMSLLQKQPILHQYSSLDDTITDYYQLNHSSHIMNKFTDTKFLPSTTITTSTSFSLPTTAVPVLPRKEEDEIITTDDNDDFSSVEDTLSDYFSEDLFDNDFDCMIDYLSE